MTQPGEGRPVGVRDRSRQIEALPLDEPELEAGKRNVARQEDRRSCRHQHAENDEETEERVQPGGRRESVEQLPECTAEPGAVAVSPRQHRQQRDQQKDADPFHQRPQHAEQQRERDAATAERDELADQAADLARRQAHRYMKSPHAPVHRPEPSNPKIRPHFGGPGLGTGEMRNGAPTTPTSRLAKSSAIKPVSRSCSSGGCHRFFEAGGEHVRTDTLVGDRPS